MQRDATVCRYLFTVKLLYMFRPSHPSSGAHKTVVAACGTDHTIWGASFLKRDQIRTYLVTFEKACSPNIMIYTRGWNYNFASSNVTKSCSPDSMICTKGCNYNLCTPDDGRDGSPKYVE